MCTPSTASFKIIGEGRVSRLGRSRSIAFNKSSPGRMNRYVYGTLPPTQPPHGCLPSSWFLTPRRNGYFWKQSRKYIPEACVLSHLCCLSAPGLGVEQHDWTPGGPQSPGYIAGGQRNLLREKRATHSSETITKTTLAASGLSQSQRAVVGQANFMLECLSPRGLAERPVGLGYQGQNPLYNCILVGS